MAERILLADNEPDILRFVEVNLRLEGFEVLLASDGVQALKSAFEERPDLVLLDVMMPGLDGFEVCRRLRADPRTSHIPVIILTAKSLTVDKVVGLTAGADDYVLKPFDPMELVARVQTTLRRAQDLRGSSPLTGLPGNHRIEAEISRRLQADERIALVYADLNDFKAYNDHYGFLRGDDVIRATAEVIRTALAEHGGHEPFLGHIGGDDFMAVVDHAAAVPVCKAVMERFDAMITSLYDDDDVAKGYIEVSDRRGQMQRFPLMTVALGVATTGQRSFVDHRGMVAVATEMKAFLKRQGSRVSAYAVDGRSE